MITHGDVHSSNVLVTENSANFLIDWDWITIAPPERDLWFFYHVEGQEFLKRYKKHTGGYEINKDICLFYMLNRFLIDVHHFINGILFHYQSQEQKFKCIENISHYMIDRLPLLRI